jgi:hypothetical protein
VYQRISYNVLEIPTGPTGKYPIKIPTGFVTPGIKTTIIKPTKGHSIPLTTPNDWILYTWGPGKWDIDTGWLIRCGDRYYAPEQGYGVLLREPYEILPLRKETNIEYLLAIEPN